jgi:hypothetical protein
MQNAEPRARNLHFSFCLGHVAHCICLPTYPLRPLRLGVSQFWIENISADEPIGL